MFRPVQLFILLTIVLLSALVATAFVDYWRFVQAPLQLSEPQTIEVEAGSSQHALIHAWKERGWLDQAQRDPIWLRVHQRLTQDTSTIKAGEYAVRPGQSLLQTLAMIQSGDVIRYTFTIIEGWNFSELRRELVANNQLNPATANWSNEELMQALGAADLHPEGQFLPETYAFSKGADDLDILRQAYEAMQKALQQAWAQRQDNLPLENAYQALVLASIIEKETALAEERALIAGVFINRLRKGMRLQTDPTVIYGMGSRFDGNIRRKDLTTDTPYNTYTRGGLPPTPIALPGEDALKASTQPQQTDKLYFVATGQGGRHYFSKNLREHQDAVRRYQLKK